MTVEFPSPVEEHPPPNDNSNNESSSEDNKLSCQQSNASSEDLMDNAYNSAHNMDNDTMLRRITEEVSDEKSLFNNNTITTAILDNDTTLTLEKERECPATRRQSSYNSEEDDHEYQRDNSINIVEEEDNELLGSIAGGRYGGRPSMRCSTSSNEDGNNIPYSNSSSNSHYLVASKRKVVSSMTSITRRSGMGSEVISTAIATGGGGNNHGGTTTNSYHPKNSAGSGGGGVNNNNNNEREEEVEDGYDVRAAFEKEHKAVRKFKVVVVVVLVAAAVAVSAVVYRFTSNGERQNLQAEYNDYAAKFITNFHHLAVMRQWAAYSVAAQFTAKCLDNYGPEEKPWPNATLPDFHDQVRGLLVLAHGVNIEFSPFFPNNETIRSEWEAYAVESEAMTMYVPEWAKRHTAEGDGDHGVMDHGGAMDSQAHGMDGNAGHDRGGDMGGVSNMEANHDVGDTSSSSTHKMDSEFDMGPDMNEAVELADGKRLLRGRSLQDEHDMSGTSTNDEAHVETPHQDHPANHDKVDPMANLKPYDDGGCVGVSEVSKDMLPPSWGGTSSTHVHPSRPIDEGIYTMDGVNVVDETHDASEMPYLAPSWQIHPPIGNEGRVMYNEYSDCHRRRAINTMLKTGGPAMSEVLVGFEDHHHFFDEPASILLYPVHNNFDEKDRTLVGFVTITFHWLGTFWNILPHNIRGVVAVIETSSGQTTSFQINGKHGIFMGEGDLHDKKWEHMRHSSSVYRVYEKDNDVTEMVGHHRDLFRYLEELGSGKGEKASEALVDGEHIDYKLHIYPSDEFEACYLTNQPRIFSLAVSLVFLVTVISFIVYDILVEKRQKKLLENAERSGKVVASLFPAMVRDRLFYERQTRDEERMNTGLSRGVSEISRLRKFMAPAPHQSQSQSHFNDSDTATAVSGSAPAIADLYNDTTVLFADIAGFTAWSSEREPTQVFQLLESLFCEFDSEAKSMKVFKIETIGDCYVAVTGLPEANPDHAVIMAKFAQRCLLRFNELTKELELSLGPGTADLGIRIGMHSGPVTAGVLRGEKARFQLFGDTMNTASRMESTSIKNMIQVTADTAALLKKSGKGHTLIAREGLIKAKGKGYMQTYWLRPTSLYSSDSGNLPERLDTLRVSQHEVDHIHSRAQQDVAREKLGLPSFSHHQQDLLADNTKMQQELVHSWNDTGFNDISKNDLEEGLNRLIKWNTAVLESILTKIVVQQNEQRKQNSFKPSKEVIEYDESARFHEEIATAVKMPPFDREAMSAAYLMPSNEKVNLIPPIAREELRGYVARIASMYQDVHFHSFEHASHVTMSAQKLINKVVLRNSTELNNSMHMLGDDTKKGEKDLQKQKEADLFFSTYGISSDPLAQFAVVFAALVHDVEHRGVPNVQLIKEQPDLAMKYKNKSIAENNSIRIAWRELLKPEFANLRRCIFGSDGDESRFRQLLINVVIATDITDRERRAGERERWQAAFLSNGDDFNWEKEWQNKSEDKLPDIDVSLKATVVLEQIVLASDVAHTMQHWLTYVKWNERLYKEMWAAYASGRAEKDPTEGWYKGEIGFFDGYIIPLATKLKECGVFGNAGDEYLGNALRNKAEWIEKGQAIVAEFEAKIKRKSDVDTCDAGTLRKGYHSTSCLMNK